MVKLSLRFYTRPVCPLCDLAVASFKPWLEAGEIELEFINIEKDEALEKKWGQSIPVLEFNGRTLAKGRFDAAEVMARLERWQEKEAPSET